MHFHIFVWFKFLHLPQNFSHAQERSRYQRIQHAAVVLCIVHNTGVSVVVRVYVFTNSTLFSASILFCFTQFRDVFTQSNASTGWTEIIYNVCERHSRFTDHKELNAAAGCGIRARDHRHGECHACC